MVQFLLLFSRNRFDLCFSPSDYAKWFILSPPLRKLCSVLFQIILKLRFITVSIICLRELIDDTRTRMFICCYIDHKVQ